MNRIYNILIIICLAFLMEGCASDGPKGPRIDYGRLRLGRMDLSGAVSIGLKTAASSRTIDGEYLSAGLYKVDASGNISAVGVYFTTDTAGNRLEHEEVLRVVPKYLHNLTDNYMLVSNCSYFDTDGDMVSNKYDYDKDGNPVVTYQEVPYKNLLVRKNDGKIVCIDKVAELLCSHYYDYLNPDIRYLDGVFKEDGKGNLYFNKYGKVFKFNLGERGSSLEQITTNLTMWWDNFDIADNGVVWSANSYGSHTSTLSLEWPKSGFQELKNEVFIRENAEKLRRSIPGGTFNSQYGSWTSDSLFMELRECYSIFANYKHNPIAVTMTPASVRTSSGNGFNSGFFTEAQESRFKESLKQSNWPGCFMYEINIGSTPGKAGLCDNPIQLMTSPELEFKFSDWNGLFLYGYEFKSVYMGENYILTADDFGNITRIDLDNRRWDFLKTLKCKIDFDDCIDFDDKIWTFDETRENAGAYWFDPVSFEEGFIRFNVNIPSFYTCNFSNWHYDNGKIWHSIPDPATGNIVKITIDLMTGEAITDEASPDLLFETLINLN